MVQLCSVSRLRQGLLVGFPLALAAYAVAQPLPDRWPLHGRVVDLDGHPVGGVMVTLARADRGLAGAYWGGSTGSNAKGEFEFPGVEEGRYVVRVDPAPVAGGSGMRLGATRLDFRGPGPPVEVVLRPPARLHVLRPDGQSLTAAPIQILTVQGDPARLNGMRGMSTTTTQTDTHGVVTTNQRIAGDDVQDLLEMTTVTMAVAPGVGVGLVPAADAADPRQPLEVRLHPAGGLHYIAHERNQGAAERLLGGARLQLAPGAVPDPEPQGVDGHAVPADHRAANFYRMASPHGLQGALDAATRDGTGDGDLADLLPGTYEVALTLSGYRRSQPQVVTITAGQVTTADFDLEPMVPPATLDLDLGLTTPVANDTMLSILMTPATDGPRTAATILSSAYRRARVEADGHVRLYPVLPGRWNLRMGSAPAMRSAGNVTMLGLNGDNRNMTVTVEAPRTTVAWPVVLGSVRVVPPRSAVPAEPLQP